jgi:polysaccharide pyruvyl transferase WcaK-like protein
MTSDMTSVGYVGWVGENNLGDDGIYKSIKNNSKTLELKTSQYADNAKITLLGGGTILPFVFQSDIFYHFEERELNAAVGVGVAEPGFENRQRAPLDIRKYCAELGIDTRSMIETMGTAGDLIRVGGNALPGVLLTGTYCHGRHYKQAGELLDILTVRGPRSKRVLSQYGVESKIVGDTALLLEPDEYHKDASNKVIICLRQPGPGRKWIHDTTYINSILQFCNSLPDSTEKVFLPLQPSDIPLHRNLTIQTTNSVWKDFVSVVDIEGVLNEISSAEVVVGEKLHANIFSACCLTPFISLEYAPKNLDFAASVGMEKFNKKINEIDSEWLLESYNKAIDFNIENIQRSVDRYRRRLKQVLDEIESY